MPPLDPIVIDASLTGIFRFVIPEAILVGVACVLYLAATIRLSRESLDSIALLGLAAALFVTFQDRHHLDATSIGSATIVPLKNDGLAKFVRVVALLSGTMILLLGWRDSGKKTAEYLGSLLVAVAGFSLCGAANDLVVLFLALEMISIPTYVMLYLPNQSGRSQEAAIKYFLLSIASSGMLLFGFSYLYGLSGSTNISAIMHILPSAVGGDQAFMAIISVVMILAGIGFRLTAFPFHFYAPDVYAGGPNGTVALLAFVPKLAGFAALLRLFNWDEQLVLIAPEFVSRVMLLLWMMAAVSMTAGNVLAMLQTNVRRILAYSGVSNAGFMLIGMAVLPTQAYIGDDDLPAVSGGEALLFYIIAYGIMILGVFAVLSLIHTRERGADTIDDMAGLRYTHPWESAILAVLLFGLIGLPLTVGFAGKFLLFSSALSAPAKAPFHTLYQWLAVIGAINAAISAYYYLKIISSVYLRESNGPQQRRDGLTPALMVAIFCVILTIGLGVYPKPLLDACRIALGMP